MKTKYTTLLLDADGTLLDFDEAERQGLQAVLQAYGVTPSKELELRYHEINKQYWAMFERGDIPKSAIMERRYPHFFRTLGVDVEAAAVEKLYRSHLDCCAALLHGAWELCETLSTRYQLYIITNGVSQTQYRRLKDSGLDLFFQDVFVSEDAGSQKPQREYFDYCFARISEKDPARMLVIGDSLTSDIQGGKNAGLDTCWVNLKNEICPETLKPDFEIHALDELMELL